MKITVLVENTGTDAVRGAHGLSLYVETAEHRLLFDFGPDGELLKENAAALGIDLAAVDVAILSHGHDDHAGGLKAFLETNDRAKVCAHRLAFLPHYSIRDGVLKEIGADASLPEQYPGRILLTEGVYRIDESLTLFSDIPGRELVSGANGTLFENGPDGTPVPDRFLHEQDLLIREGDELVLVAGCAHRGLVNVLRRAEEIGGRTPDAVVSGFHLTNPGMHRDEPEALIRAVGEALQGLPCRYHTGHCTGTGPFGILKELLGDRLEALFCGRQFEI